MSKIQSKYEFSSYHNGTCALVVDLDFSDDDLKIPELSPDGEKVISLSLELGGLNFLTFKNVIISRTLKNVPFNNIECDTIDIAPQNPYFSVFDGVVFDKKMKNLIYCPKGKNGKFIVPATVRDIESWAFLYANLQEVVFQEGLETIEHDYSLYGLEIVTLPLSVWSINEDAFEGDDYSNSPVIIRAPRNSYAISFAIKHGYRYAFSNDSITWNEEEWLKKFNKPACNFRQLRKEVWENTKAIVEANGYTLSDKKSVLLLNSSEVRNDSSFYEEAFTAAFEPLRIPAEITVVPDDCLDVAHKFVNEGLEVCVLNMASRQNPGGGVVNGAGAQEEYLFRCSDYYKFLYKYAPYAEQYGIMRSLYQYPLDRNFGGIYSPEVTIFRENEQSGYKLAASTWKVNMIAVAGMNSPKLIYDENGEKRIAPELIEGVKNKIRTIFRIACDNGQRNLVLGALGCGAFHNPPEHVAELFRDVLCEQEFEGAFSKICFAVKTDHNSNGDSNYSAFKKILHGFIPTVKGKGNVYRSQIQKIAISRDDYALLKKNGEAVITNIYTGTSRKSTTLRSCSDIAGGFHNFIGLKSSQVVVEATGSQASDFWDTYHWSRGISVAACEGHAAVLRNDGTVLCDDDDNMDIPKYKKHVAELKNIRQIALTFEQFYYLTKDGKLMFGDNHEDDFFNDGRKIYQIAVFGCYYSMNTVAALYFDGTVKASYDGCPVKEVEKWNSVKKICCGNHGCVFGLTGNGKVLLPQDNPYEDRDNNLVTEINDIVVDIAANFNHFIALTASGKIIYLCESMDIDNDDTEME